MIRSLALALLAALAPAPTSPAPAETAPVVEAGQDVCITINYRRYCFGL